MTALSPSAQNAADPDPQVSQKGWISRLRSGQLIVQSRRAQMRTVCLCVAGALCVWIYFISDWNRKANVNFSDMDTLLADIKQLDTQWSSDVLRLQLGFINNFDPLVTPLPRLRAYEQTLATLQSQLELSPTEIQRLATLNETFKTTMARKAVLVDQMKSQSAILKNSSRFLPSAAAHFTQELARSGASAEVQALAKETFYSTIGDTLSILLLHEDSARERVQTGLMKIRQSVANLSPAAISASEAVASHVRLILREQAHGNTLLLAITNLPVTKAIDDLRADYAALRDYKTRTRIFEVMLCAGLALILIVYVLSDMYRAYRALNRSKTQLERDNDEAQTQLIQSVKMSALGQMMAGITHEINTPLSYVKAVFNVLQDILRPVMETAPDPDGFREALAAPKSDSSDSATLMDDINSLLVDGLHGVDQISALVRSMKNFSRLDRDNFSSVSMEQLLEDALLIARHEIKYVAEVEKDFQPIPNVICAPAQISQVFLNILNNAAQALPGVPTKGIITLRTRMESPGQIRVEIADNGSGIPAHVLPKIFDPFFTTKKIGDGTGMGLSISYRIIRNHGGKISVDSREGVGTTFAILLPVAARLPQTEQTTKSPKANTSASSLGVS